MSLVLLDRKSEYICLQETGKLCYSTVKSIHSKYITRKYTGIYYEGKAMKKTNVWESEKQQTG